MISITSDKSIPIDAYRYHMSGSTHEHIFTHKIYKGKLRVFYFIKPYNVTEQEILFVMHGAGYNTQSVINRWTHFARHHNLILIAPEFKNVLTGYNKYCNGNIVSDRGIPTPKIKWSFTVIEDLFDFFKEQTGINKNSYSIIGYSAGAHFVHRMIMFCKGMRVKRAIANCGGWYWIPNNNIPYPHGFGGMSITDEQLVEAYSKKLYLFAGTNDKASYKHKYSSVTGENRYECACNFYAFAFYHAYELGVEFNWEFLSFPDCGHCDQRMEYDGQCIIKFDKIGSLYDTALMETMLSRYYPDYIYPPVKIIRH